MIRITQMLLIFATICLIYITRIISTDENLSHISQYIQPIEYNISVDIQNTSLFVNSTVLLNVSCAQHHIRLQIGRYCNLTENINVTTNIRHYIPLRWNSTRLQSSYSSKHQFDNVDISLDLDVDQLKLIQPGLYAISSICKCKLKEVASVFRYRKRKIKKYVILPRIPNEWIFPYWENPAIKARFTIQIKHKNNDTVLSNMPVAKTFRTHKVFLTTPSISTHLVALVVIPHTYKTDNEPKNNVTIVSTKMITGTSYARTYIRDIIGRIRNMWNDIIPLSHVNYVLLPIAVTDYESIITNGLLFINEANIIYNRTVDSIVKERKVKYLVARCVILELFTEWLATFRQSDSWFLEGFSTIYGIYLHDKKQCIFLKCIIFLETYVGTVLMVLMESFMIQTRRIFLDYTEVVSRYYFPFQENRFITQNLTVRKLWRDKAFSTFYMLSTIFEEDFLFNLFTEAVNLYYNTDDTSNNTYNKLPILDQLWFANFETKLYTFTRIKSTDIKQMITSWISQIGYPLVQVGRHNNIVSAMVIDCFDVDYNKRCENKWWVPVTFKKIRNTQVLATLYQVLKPDGKPIFTSLSDNNEITIVVDHPGYRVNYDRESWKHIILYLNTVNSTTADISNVTKAQLLDDAFYFLVQNTQYNEDPAENINDLDMYLELARSIFYVNTSYTAWYPVFIALENMSKMFPFPESFLSKHIKDKLLEILNRFLDNMSYTHPSENSVNNQFYHEILKWTCILGSSKCKERINGILEWHFKHPAQNRLLPSWQKWIYCQRLMLENVTYNMSASWQKIFKIYRKERKTEELFEFLPCSRQYKNLLHSLVFLEYNFLLPPENSSYINKKNDTVLNKEMSDKYKKLFEKKKAAPFVPVRGKRFIFIPLLENNTLPIPESSLNGRKKSHTVLKRDLVGLFNQIQFSSLLRNLTATKHLTETRQLTETRNFTETRHLTETSDTGNIVNAKESVRVTLLFNIFSLHSKDNSALYIILIGLENGIGRDVNILAIINCVINNIYLDDDLAMINQMFLDKLIHIHHMEPLVLDAIRKKVENRRGFLNKMLDKLRYKPQDVFKFNLSMLETHD